MLVSKAEFVMLLLRLNLEGEVTASLRLRVLSPKSC